MTKRRKAGEVRRASPIARTSTVGKVDRPPGPRRKKGHLAASERGNFSSTTASSLTRVARPPSIVATQDKNQCLRADVQLSSGWVNADSAVNEHGAFAKLLKGRTGYASGVSSNVGSCEYSRVSLPDSVVDEPPLTEMLLAEARIFLEEVLSHGCCSRQT